MSFLSSRTQCVKHKNVYSDLLPVYCGVPQGTLLGLLLFLIIINGLATEHTDCWKFVDDMSLLEKSFRKNLKSSAMEIMEDISSDAAQADMTVNAKKSNIMTISFLKSTPSFKQPIPPEMSVQQCKLLGITISSNLKWEVHVTNITKQANLALSTLKFFFKFSCPAFHLLRIYTSFIRPVLEYSCPVWHFGLTTSQSYSIESVQKRSIKNYLWSR